MANHIKNLTIFIALITCSYFIVDISHDYFSREIITEVSLDHDYEPNPAVSICLPYLKDHTKKIKILNKTSEEQFIFNGKTCSKTKIKNSEMEPGGKIVLKIRTEDYLTYYVHKNSTYPT